MTTYKTLRIAALALCVSAILHLIAPLVSGFSSAGLILVPFGGLYLVFAYGLLREWRWLAYIAFVVLIFGIIVSLGLSYGAGPVPSWVYTGIFGADVIAWGALFGFLWMRNPKQGHTLSTTS